jgi:pilus assembly protein CpaB
VRRRVVALIAAVVLAGMSGAILVAYVSRADARAMAGLQTVNVLVVKTQVPKDTEGKDLAGLVQTRVLPATAVAPGSVHSLRDLDGLVSTVDLQPGEQVLRSRFADPATLANGGEVKVPAGMQTLTLALPMQRALGGRVVPKAQVGIFVSLPGDGAKNPPTTHLVLQKVLVTKVEGAPPAAAEEGAKATTGGNDALMVTFALPTADVEKVVFGAEHGTVWLSEEYDETTEDGTRVISPASVYK